MANSLVELLQFSANRSPRSEAVVLGSERLSYAELWRRAQSVAGFLQAQGLVPGERVALVLENSPIYIAAYYGVLAAGGVVVALNTAVKERDLLGWIQHSGASWLIGDATHDAWQGLCQSASGLRVVQVGGTVGDQFSWEQVLAGTPATPVEIAAASPAAIIYTSGTTGRPKGVMLSHRNLLANTQSILEYLPIETGARIVNVLPFYYSYGNSVLHTHLAAGACLVLENSLTYPHRVVESMVREKATGFSGVPSTFALLLSRVKLQDYDLSALRYLTQAGGAMPPALTKRLLEALPSVSLYVMYGQTEASARLSYLPPERLQEKMGSAGKAIPGVTLEIRGDDDKPVATGVAGEIWAQGDNVMPGYWNDVDATQSVLRDGWLKTGDMASMDSEGYLYIQGRRSDMIKTGAHRVAPNEIEEVIAEIDGVAEVAVVGVDDEILGQVIKAVVLPRPGASVDGMRVKAHCRDRLALYKIPKYVELVTELPKTASGKIQRFMLSNHSR